MRVTQRCKLERQVILIVSQAQAPQVRDCFLEGAARSNRSTVEIETRQNYRRLVCILSETLRRESHGSSEASEVHLTATRLITRAVTAEIGSRKSVWRREVAKLACTRIKTRQPVGRAHP